MRGVRTINLASVCAAFAIAAGMVSSAFAQATQSPSTETNSDQAVGDANGPKGSSAANPKPTPHTYNGINQMPWFANSSVREELELDDARFDVLSQGYQKAWSHYSKGMTSLNTDMPPDRMSLQQQELADAFHRELDQHTNVAFAEQNARDRYNQLYLQYRGYSAFNDPSVQKRLDLTQEQAQRLNQYNHDWNSQMRQWNSEYRKDPNTVRQEFNAYGRTYQQNLNATLTPQQRTTWETMTGSRFNFTPDYYFENNRIPAVIPGPGSK